MRLSLETLEFGLGACLFVWGRFSIQNPPPKYSRQQAQLALIPIAVEITELSGKVTPSYITALHPLVLLIGNSCIVA